MNSSPRHRLTQILPNLWATRAEFPFGGTTPHTKAFLIQRSKGTTASDGGNKNVWVYASSHVEDYLSHIAELGGVSLQVLNHRDEASKFCNVLRTSNDGSVVAPVFCHSKEKTAIEQKGSFVDKTFDGDSFEIFDDQDGGNLTAYHTPGHTKGVTSYLWKTPSTEGVSVLFTGDSLYPNNQGILAPGVMAFYPYPGNREDMIRSYELYLQLNPTYVVPGLSMSGEFLNEFDVNQVKFLLEKLKQEIE